MFIVKEGKRCELNNVNNVNSHSDSPGYHGESIPIEAGRCLSRSGKSFWHSYPTHEGDSKGAMRERLRRGIVSKCG